MTSANLSSDPVAISEFIKKFDTFLFDCDGVLWSGNQLYPMIAETLDMLRGKGKKLVFVTNNSTKSRNDYVKKFAGLGIQVSENEIFASSYSAAVYLSHILKLPADKSTVFLLSESGTEQELASQGVNYIGGTDPAYRRDIDISHDLAQIASGAALDKRVGAVVLALDFHVNYYKLALATAYVQRGAVLLATNTDSTLPHSGSLFPGAGSVGAGVVRATGKAPIVLGKPSLAMMDAIEGCLKLDRKRTCMVGDRLDTDIKFGNDGGLGGTLLVLTGVATSEEVKKLTDDSLRPSVVLNQLGDLLLAK